LRGERGSLFEGRVFEKRERELIWPEGSVTGTAVTYVMVRIAIR
jgi:hypothetical protein